MDWADQFFVFFAKNNVTGDPNVGPSHMRISAFELDEFIAYIDHILDEIENCKPELILSLKHPHAAIWDPNGTCVL